MNLLVKMATEKEITSLREQFEVIDADQSGFILASELSKILKDKHMQIADSEIEQMIKEIDYHGNGKINYSEFLSATINLQTFLTEQKLQAVFS